MNQSENPEDLEFWFERTMNIFQQEVTYSDRLADWEDAPTTRAERLDLLWSYVTGDPPLPRVAPRYRSIFAQVLRKARTNIAQLVVEAQTDHSRVSNVTTESDQDFDGDDFARQIHRVSGFPAMHSDMQTYLATFGEAYIQVVPPLEGASPDAPPMFVAEDPRGCASIPNPLMPGRLTSWVKVYNDDALNQQVAIFCWFGSRYVIRREPELFGDTFNIEEWDLSNLPGETPVSMPELELFGGVPVVRFDNKYGMGEFESHIDLIDRIIDSTLHLAVIKWYQAFKQRAVVGNLDGGEDFSEADDEVNSLIRSMQDGDDALQNLFEADPGSLWLLPEGVSFWESSSADFRQLIDDIEADIKKFAAVTRTPLSMFNPDGVNQTAEGAVAMRESHLDKVEDRQARQTPGLILLHQIAFALAGQESKAPSVDVTWSSAERLSLASKGDFIAKASDVLSRKRICSMILEMTPDEIRLNEKELMEELMMASTLAMTAAPAPSGGAPEAGPETTPDEPAATESEPATEAA